MFCKIIQKKSGGSYDQRWFDGKKEKKVNFYDDYKHKMMLISFSVIFFWICVFCFLGGFFFVSNLVLWIIVKWLDIVNKQKQTSLWI